MQRCPPKHKTPPLLLADEMSNTDTGTGTGTGTDLAVAVPNSDLLGACEQLRAQALVLRLSALPDLSEQNKYPLHDAKARKVRLLCKSVRVFLPTGRHNAHRKEQAALGC